MAFHQSFGAATTQFQSSEDDVSIRQNKNSDSIVSENSTGFDCNICLDSCQEPVVTLCGHLYCWPCIYKWLQVQSSPFESDDHPKCPVCKAYISTSSLVPLYGRGPSSSSDSETKKPQLRLAIPPRPPATAMSAHLAAPASTDSGPGPNQQTHTTPFRPQLQTFHQQQYFPNSFGNFTSATPALGGTTTTSFYSPTINMVGEMVFARMFGSSDTRLFAYPYSNSYPFTGNGSPRLRRQEMQLDKSLNRVSIFLFCCIALCLLLF